MFKLVNKIVAALAVVSMALFGSANAKTLKFETHFSAAQPSGEVATQLAKMLRNFLAVVLKFNYFMVHL